MLGMKNETCKIAMSYEIINFRNIVIKPFFRDKSENVADVKNEKNTDHINEIGNEISHVVENEKTFFSNSSFASKRGRDRSRKLSLRYKNFETNISIFYQNDQHMQTPGPFVKSRKKK